MTNTQGVVYGGVDTHQDTHVVAALDGVGRMLGTRSFSTDQAGLQEAHRWLAGHGTIVRVGVEGTGSYGAGLTRCLHAQGVTVVEVNRPNRQTRRAQGKSDPIDAESAARAVLAEAATVVPKTRDGIVEAIRTLKVVLDGTRTHQTQIIERLHHLIVTAPTDLRAGLMPLTSRARIARCARMRPVTALTDVADPAVATKHALRTLARQYQQLAVDHKALTSQLDTLTWQANPALRAAYGVGPDTAAALLVAAGDNPRRLVSEAAFAMLCGAAPIPASSGKTTAMRLNRGGNRQANSALHRIVLQRLRNDPSTQDYMRTHLDHSKGKAAIMRVLKRYVARQVYKLLTEPPALPRIDDLAGLRAATRQTQAQIATQLGTHPAVISRIEHGKAFHHKDLIAAYRDLLENTPATP